MQNAQEVYNRILETKQKIKDIKAELKGYYQDIPEYVDLEEKLKDLRAKRKRVTLSVDNQHPDLITKLEDLKIDLASDKEMLNDIVVSTVMKGETVELQNQYQQAVLPIFSVTLKPE